MFCRLRQAQDVQPPVFCRLEEGQAARREDASMTPTRPVLRWHGGKWVLAPWIIEHFPPHRTYTEVFGGAASVLIRKPRAHAEVYNDLDGEVVNLFRVLQSDEQSARLTKLLYLTPFARAEFDMCYEPTEDTVERARRPVTEPHI